MAISFSCPGCRRPYQVQEQMAGQAVKCACGSQFVVPQARLARAAVAAPPQDNWLDQELAAHQKKQADAAAAVAAEREKANNPYAAPGMGAGMNQYGSPNLGGLWREGQLLVMDRNARLPNICVKSGQPAQRFLVRNLSWQPQWIRVMQVIFGGLVYAILVRYYAKRATIHIALSEEEFKKRSMFLMIGWIGALAGVAIAGGALAIGIPMENPGLLGIGIIVGCLMILAFGLTGNYGARMVWADLITERHVWVGGVCEAFLQQLPPWTGGRPQ